MMISVVDRLAKTIPPSRGDPRPGPEPAPSAPLDAVALSAAPSPTLRPLFQDAARLGLLAAGASIGGPLGQALSADASADLHRLLDELQAAGYTFQASHNRPEEMRAPGWSMKLDRLEQQILESKGDWAQGHRPSPSFTTYQGEEITVSGHGIDRARVTSLYDLQALEAIALTGDTSALSAPALADDLRRLEGRHLEFHLSSRDPKSDRAVGAYGAYRALTAVASMAPDEPAMLEARRADTEAIPLRKTADLDGLRYFTLGDDVPSIGADPRAPLLRDLERDGATFHHDYDRDQRRYLATSVFEEARKDLAHLRVGIRGAAIEPLKADSQSPALQDLRAYNAAVIEPRVQAGALTPAQADRCLAALQRPLGDLGAADRGAVLDRLVQLERDLQTPNAVEVAADALDALADATRAGENPAITFTELENLRRDIPSAQVAFDTLRHVRLVLPSQSFDADDLASQRARVVRTARLAPSFDEARQALELLEITPPFEEGAAALERLTVLHRGIAGDDRSPLQRALDDYKLVQRHRLPGESLHDACDTLETLYAALLPRETWAAAREAFRYVEHGLSRNAFPARSKAEVVDHFLQTWIMSQDLERARRSVERPPAGTDKPEVVTGNDDVTIGGIRIPRRK